MATYQWNFFFTNKGKKLFYDTSQDHCFGFKVIKMWNKIFIHCRQKYKYISNGGNEKKIPCTLGYPPKKIKNVHYYYFLFLVMTLVTKLFENYRQFTSETTNNKEITVVIIKDNKLLTSAQIRKVIIKK